MTRSKRSAGKEEFWRLVVDEHRGCGLNIRTFCQQKGISEPSFYAWRKEPSITSWARANNLNASFGFSSGVFYRCGKAGRIALVLQPSPLLEAVCVSTMTQSSTSTMCSFARRP